MTKREFIQQGVIALMGNPTIIDKNYLDKKENYKNYCEEYNRKQEDRLIELVYDIADNMENSWDLGFDVDEENSEE